ncbi:MAG: DUF6458 family protein [Microthrixaceae bacterium]
MGYGVSIFFLAVGAALTWAVDATVKGLDLQTIGVILMVVGGVGLMFSLLYWSMYTERRGTRTTVVDDRDLAP